MTNTPAGWYPTSDGTLRYWDGQQWTNDPAPQVTQQVEYIREEPADAHGHAPAPAYSGPPAVTPRGYKEQWVAYVLWLLGGGLGLHRFYLRRIRSAIALLVTFVAGFVSIPVAGLVGKVVVTHLTAVDPGVALITGLAFVLLGVLPHLVVGVWLICDLFLIPRMTREANTSHGARPSQEATRAERISDEPVSADQFTPYDNQAPATGPKSVAVAYVLLVVLGFFAAHRYYLGRPGTAIFINVLGFGGIVSLLIPGASGILMMSAAGIWLLVDLFLIPRMVRGSSR